MIRKGDWKLIFYCDGPHQLFNLKEDPHEIRNAYQLYPQKAKELEQELRGLCSPETENLRAHAFVREQLRTVAAIESSA